MIVEGSIAAGDSAVLTITQRDPARAYLLALAEAVAASIRELTKLRGEVVFCAPGSLANDGRIIDDIRKYE